MWTQIFIVKTIIEDKNINNRTIENTCLKIDINMLKSVVDWREKTTIYLFFVS